MRGKREHDQWQSSAHVGCLQVTSSSDQSAIMLGRVVELCQCGHGLSEIADELKISLDEVERLLAFHVDDQTLHAAEQITFGSDIAEELRCYRLTDDETVLDKASDKIKEIRRERSRP
ncbi:hypothetical protein LHT11_07360 [Acetobacter indonesiensis]|uniref:hypothetical protein n=1 Tax=Acetobacter indonesiensis TaxID=104101 RepID=UPI001F1AD3BE|nr:hypothetical protein [Acetobacter indonesiensis]MCG0995015.1 hypothetical protein [Acetobacter indonesiensis]